MFHDVPALCRHIARYRARVRSNPAAAVVTHGQLSEFAELQTEIHREHDDRHRGHEANHHRLQRVMEAKFEKLEGELASSVTFFLSTLPRVYGSLRAFRFHVKSMG